jgi:hypothetical protein
MKYIIPEPQTEPFRPHEIKPEDWELLKDIGSDIKTNMTADEVSKLFKRWMDDRLLHHNPVKPLIFYSIISNLIKHRRIKIRKEMIDTRIPLLLYMPSGY